MPHRRSTAPRSTSGHHRTSSTGSPYSREVRLRADRLIRALIDAATDNDCQMVQAVAQLELQRTGDLRLRRGLNGLIQAARFKQATLRPHVDPTQLEQAARAWLSTYADVAPAPVLGFVSGFIPRPPIAPPGPMPGPNPPPGPTPNLSTGPDLDSLSLPGLPSVPTSQSNQPQTPPTPQLDNDNEDDLYDSVSTAPTTPLTPYEIYRNQSRLRPGIGASKRRTGVYVQQGQGAMGRLDRLHFYSTAFSSCTPLVLVNRQNRLGALFHVSANSVARQTDEIVELLRFVAPTHIHYFEGGMAPTTIEDQKNFRSHRQGMMQLLAQTRMNGIHQARLNVSDDRMGTISVTWGDGAELISGSEPRTSAWTDLVSTRGVDGSHRDAVIFTSSEFTDLSQDFPLSHQYMHGKK